MASQQGIQQLLQAEQRAQEIISKARKGIVEINAWKKKRNEQYLTLFLAEKTTLLKAAKDEADKEVASFRGQKEGQFQDYIKKVRTFWSLCFISMFHGDGIQTPRSHFHLTARWYNWRIH